MLQQAKPDSQSLPPAVEDIPLVFAGTRDISFRSIQENPPDSSASLELDAFIASPAAAAMAHPNQRIQVGQFEGKSVYLYAEVMEQEEPNLDQTIYVLKGVENQEDLEDRTLITIVDEANNGLGPEDSIRMDVFEHDLELEASVLEDNLRQNALTQVLAFNEAIKVFSQEGG